MTAIDEIVLTFPEACEWSHRSRATLYRWIASGDLTTTGDTVRLSDLLRVERDKRRQVARRRAHLARKLTA